MKTAYSYLRWSTVTQGETGKDSRTRQTNSARDWMKNYGTAQGYMLSDEVFLDAGKSGFKGKHIETDEYGRAKGELARFIQCVEDGRIKRDSILLVDDFSRFSRMKPTRSLTLFMDVINSGIGLVFTGSYEKRVIDETLINKESHILGFIIGELIRSFSESEERGRKIKGAYSTKHETMKNGVIYRFKMSRWLTFVPNVGQKNIGVYVLNDKAKIIQRIVSLYLSGKSLYSIMETLNGERIPSLLGKQWDDTAIGNILRDRILIGEYKGVSNYVPAIITEREFNKIQNLLKQNVKNFGVAGEINIFRSVCYCKCGKSMFMTNQTVKNAGGVKKYKYLRCSAAGVNKTCTNRNSFPLYEMEIEFFLDFLFKTPAQLLDVNDVQEVKELKGQLDDLTTQLNTTTNAIENVVMLAQGLDLVEARTQIVKLNQKREQQRERIADINFKISKVQGMPENTVDLKQIFIRGQSVRRHEDIPVDDHVKLLESAEHTIDVLNDNFSREGLRLMMPSVVGKIVVDGERFAVFNHLGKKIYTSSKLK